MTTEELMSGPPLTPEELERAKREIVCAIECEEGFEMVELTDQEDQAICDEHLRTGEILDNEDIEKLIGRSPVRKIRRGISG